MPTKSRVTRITPKFVQGFIMTCAPHFAKGHFRRLERHKPFFEIQQWLRGILCDCLPECCGGQEAFASVREAKESDTDDFFERSLVSFFNGEAPNSLPLNDVIRLGLRVPVILKRRDHLDKRFDGFGDVDFRIAVTLICATEIGAVNFLDGVAPEDEGATWSIDVPTDLINCSGVEVERFTRLLPDILPMLSEDG